jgi:hypothetical protein
VAASGSDDEKGGDTVVAGGDGNALDNRTKV